MPRAEARGSLLDASIKNVLLAALCSPPKERPVSEIAPGFAFHHLHMGFDYRNLQALLHTWFRVQKVTSSPFSIFGLWLNPEAYFLVQKANPAAPIGSMSRPVPPAAAPTRPLDTDVTRLHGPSAPQASCHGSALRWAFNPGSRKVRNGQDKTKAE